MKIILAIGGSVIKTAYDEIKELAEKKMFDVLIHNGASLFHDFQRSTEKLKSHSLDLGEILEDYKRLEKASKLVWVWLREEYTPVGSLTNICQNRGIPVLMFTALGCDFWHLFDNDWERIARRCWFDFKKLEAYIWRDEFHFISMGSAVIHPEVFTKALARIKPKKFRADVVDFLDMYRPRTRVAKYGDYFCLSHKEYLDMWLANKKPPKKGGEKNDKRRDSCSN